jgi:hypothetical protein
MRTDLRQDLRWLALAALAAYFVVAYRVALSDLGVAEPPAAARAAKSLTWLGRWRMVTELRDHHVILEAEAQRAGQWAPVDLSAVFPSQRDEGPGHQRDDLYRSPRRLDRLGAALCHRSGADAVRFAVHRFPKTLGSRAQPAQGATVERLGERRCL